MSGLAGRASAPAPEQPLGDCDGRPSVDCDSARREVAYILRRMYQQHLTTTTGGNVSCRIDGDRIAMTPTGRDKARLEAEEVVILELDGTNLTPGLAPTVEHSMHLRLYQRHPSVGAVVHAHPPVASAFTASETPIDIRLLSEPYAVAGPIAVVPYIAYGTEELADAVAEAMTGLHCALLRNHGVVCTGRTVLEAFCRVEVIEAAAQATVLTRQLGGALRLTDEDCAKLDRAVGR